MAKDKYIKQETWNIGVVKFFDSKKGFGFIASNNCHIPRKEYVQDFHVRDSSFADASAKSDRALVVFEGISVASQVRRYNKNSEEDRRLGITYYFDHEIMHLKGAKVNIFHDLSIPRIEWLPEVIARIKSQKDRTPESTLLMIKHFVEKYKKDLPGGYRYIFTKDFDTELRNLWQELFNSLSLEEAHVVLDVYPPSAIYFDNSLVEEWIDSLGANIEPREWPDLKYCADKLIEPLQSNLKKKVKCSVDAIISHIIDNWANNKPLDAYISIYDYRNKRLRDIVSTYQIYTDTDFSEQIEAANHQRELICFQDSLISFEENPERNWDNSFRLFNNIHDDAQAVVLFSASVQKAFEKLKTANKLSALVSLLLRIKSIFPELFITYSNELWQPIEEKLLKQLNDVIQAKSKYRFETEFEDGFNTLLSIFEDDKRDSLRPIISKTIIESEAIDIINYAADSDLGWIPREKAIAKSHELLNSITDEELSSLVGKDSIYLLNEVKEFIIVRLLGAYSGKSLDEYLDDSSQAWVKPIPYNIGLLKSFKDFITFNSPILDQSWAFYVDSLNAKDILRLYHANIIKSLPDNIVASLIENLTIEDTYRSSEQWYDKPSFKEDSLKKIFSDSNINLFSPITNYLKALTINSENVYKIVWLIELLSFNKPELMDYWENKQWEEDFKLKLQRIRSEITDPKLAVILWGIYFQTPASQSSLKEIYCYLPPYLQIRILKRLMKGVAEGKLKHTAQSLYEFLGGGNKPLCLPIEIVFSYLILREKNPNERFSDKHMLSLLSSREDHPEWIGIRKFVDECQGRVQVDWPEPTNYQWRTPYYNGIMKEDSTEIQLIIPRKMVDEYGRPQQYNNKYFNVITAVISLNFNNNEVRQENTATGTVFHFEKSELKYVIGICRQFNIHWRDSRISFSYNENNDDFFCECRLANELSRNESVPFYWCQNKPCFRNIIRFRIPEEWERYTMLDFMRIFNIPVDYTNKLNQTTKFGFYIFFNTYLKGFAKFYEHLKCRKCGELLHPKDISNFATMSVTEFSCQNPNCTEKDFTVYLNHCFNRPQCTSIIDSRDSKKCPNGRYICPECGGCCSTKNELNRLSNLQITGGYIPQNLTLFIERNLGHWEKEEFYCYVCGSRMEFIDGKNTCPSCGATYGKYKTKATSNVDVPNVDDVNKPDTNTDEELPF